VKYELLALYEEFKEYVRDTYNKSWREEWEEYYTFDAFMAWLAEKVKPTQSDSEEYLKKEESE
jgi:hypothetical protein